MTRTDHGLPHPAPTDPAARTLADAARDLLLGACCVGCRTPGRLLCGRCDEVLPVDGRPAWPQPTPSGLAPPWAGGDYDGVLRAVVLQHKEHAAYALARPLGRVLAGVVVSLLDEAADSAAGAATSAARPVVLVPVPSRGAAVRARGHDPMLRTARVAAALLRRTGRHAVVRPLLWVRGQVSDQAGLDAGARAANLAGSLAVRRRARAPSGAVVVVDDVITTGSTVREAQRALEDAGVAVVAVAAVAATRRRLPTRDDLG